MKRTILVLVTLLFLLTFGPLNIPVFAKDNWLSLRSKNFLLICNTSEKQMRLVGTRLEQFREVFAQLFPKAVHTTLVPTTVIVFKSDDSYRPFKPNANTAGYFQAGPDVNYITLTTELRGERDPFTVIFHEYTHLLINNTSPNVPLWFNEGLAEYYSTLKIGDDIKVVLGTPISNHVYLLRENKMLPLRTLFKVDEKSPYYNERDKQSVFYAESWALMHYLILGKEGQRRPQMGNFLKLMAANVPLEQAFQQAFAMSFESMEKELREYIRHDRYPVMTGQFKSKLVVETDMQAAPISEAEAQAYLGDLLLHSNRADSEGYLQKSLALDPNLPMANASMAMLRLREGKTAQAQQMLERVAANSQNYLIHYYYAYALSREGQGDSDLVYGFASEAAAKMRAELKRAIELRPDFLESHSLLGFINLVTNTDIDDSIEMIKRALMTAPGKANLVFTLAQLHMRKENYKDARPLLEQLGGGSEAGVRQQAKAMLERLELMEEQLARYRAASAAQGSRSSATSPTVSQGAPEVPTNVDPSYYLREALRKPGDGETQVQGLLERIDCDAKGIIFIVRVGGQILQLRTDSFDTLNLTSFSADAGNEISCGPRKPGNDVIVCYVAGSDSRKKVDGTLRSVEFVPKDFQLKAAP